MILNKTVRKMVNLDIYNAVQKSNTGSLGSKLALKS